MSKRRFAGWFLIISLLVACGDSERQLVDVPIVVSQPGEYEIDIDLVIHNTQEEVQKILPNAYLVFFSFVGNCSELPKLQGEIRLDFAEVRRSLLGNRTFLAEATVRTSNQKLSLDVRDETEHYPNLGPLVIDGKRIPEIASILHAYLYSTNRCIGTVALTRARTESPWRVVCGHPDKVFIECIRINPLTGDVLEVR